MERYLLHVELLNSPNMDDLEDFGDIIIMVSDAEFNAGKEYDGIREFLKVVNREELKEEFKDMLSRTDMDILLQYSAKS